MVNQNVKKGENEKVVDSYYTSAKYHALCLPQYKITSLALV